MPVVYAPEGTAAASPIDLSVVILNWNASGFLADCLNSLLALPWRCAVEVIVVDNNSQIDDSLEMMRRDYPRISLLVNDRNVGFAAGNNLGAAQAAGRHLLFLNPDTIVHNDSLDLLCSYLDEHELVGACGPRMLYPNGELQASCRAFPSVGAGFFRNTLLGRIFPNNPWTRRYLMSGFAHDKVAEVDWLSGSALCVRRTAFVQIGGWDEDFFMYCEDVDLCYRLKVAGWQRVYLPEAVITHRIGASSDWAQGAMIRRHHSSMLLYFRKHYSRGAGLLVLPLAALGIGLRALGAVFKLYRGYLKAGIPVPRRVKKETKQNTTSADDDTASGA